MSTNFEKKLQANFWFNFFLSRINESIVTKSVNGWICFGTMFCFGTIFSAWSSSEENFRVRKFSAWSSSTMFCFGVIFCFGTIFSAWVRVPFLALHGNCLYTEFHLKCAYIYSTLLYMQVSLIHQIEHETWKWQNVI